MNLSDCLDSDVSLGGPPANPLSPPGGIACNATTHENTRGDFLNAKGLSVSDRDTLKTQVAYALISHGETGYGSKEYFNANAEGTYWILDPSAAGVAAEDEAHFDDIVSYAVASDLVVAAKVGGRAWPVGMTLNRTDTVAFSGSNNTLRTLSPRKISFAGGRIMMSAFIPTGAPYIASKELLAMSPFTHAIGASAASGGSGNLISGEGLGFDFKVKRRVLKVVLASFNSDDQATFTFYNGATQVGGPWTKSGCTSGADLTNFTIPVGNDFTKAEILAPTSSSASFSVASIAACKYDDASCILPGGVPANDCPPL